MAFDWKEFLKPTWQKIAIAAALFILFAPCLQTTLVSPCAPPILGQPAIECKPIISHYTPLLFCVATLPRGFFFIPEILFEIVAAGALASYFIACVAVRKLAPVLAGKPAKKSRKGQKH